MRFVIPAGVDGVPLGKLVVADAGKLEKAPGGGCVAEHRLLAVVRNQRAVVDQQDDACATHTACATTGKQTNPRPPAFFTARILPDRYQFKPRCVAIAGLQIVSSTFSSIGTPHPVVMRKKIRASTLAVCPASGNPA